MIIYDYSVNFIFKHCVETLFAYLLQRGKGAFVLVNGLKMKLRAMAKAYLFEGFGALEGGAPGVADGAKPTASGLRRRLRRCFRRHISTVGAACFCTSKISKLSKFFFLILVNFEKIQQRGRIRCTSIVSFPTKTSGVQITSRDPTSMISFPRIFRFESPRVCLLITL